MYKSYKDVVCTDLKPTTCHAEIVEEKEVKQSAEKVEPEESVSQELTVEDAVKERWEKEQMEMVKQVVIKDVDDWAKYRVTPENCSKYPDVRPLEHIGGVDISFIKGDNINACAAFVVLNYPNLEVVYEDLSMVKLTAPYIPGYLAFREANFLVDKIRRLQSIKPALTPQVIMSDGNGILHPRKFGLACHLGVMTGIPQLGAAKNLFAVRGIEKDAEFDTHIRRMTKGGDAFPLRDEYGEILGAALKPHEGCKNPVYVSPGHMLSVTTAVWITKICCKYRVPEPTRQADQRSREYLRVHFPTERQIQPKRQPRGQKAPRHNTKNDPNSGRSRGATGSENDNEHSETSGQEVSTEPSELEGT